MKKNEKKLYKSNKNVSDADYDIKKFLIILTILIVVVVGLYFLSNAIVNKRDNKESNVNTNVTISYDTLNVGMIFNRPYDDAMVYSTLITNYTKKENSIKIYYCDLNKIVNKDYKSKDGKSNPNASSVQELSFNEVTLLKIRNKKVVNYIDNIDQIKSTLK